MILSTFKLWLFPENRIVQSTKITTFWPTKSNLFCVTNYHCRKQPLLFKQVKTFLARPNAWSGSATVSCTKAAIRLFQSLIKDFFFHITFMDSLKLKCGKSKNEFRSNMHAIYFRPIHILAFHDVQYYY